MAASLDEKIPEAVRRFPVLYDKSCKDFKDNNKKKNAWEDVTKTPGLSSRMLKLQNRKAVIQTSPKCCNSFSLLLNPAKCVILELTGAFLQQQNDYKRKHVSAARLKFNKSQVLMWMAHSIMSIIYTYI